MLNNDSHPSTPNFDEVFIKGYPVGCKLVAKALKANGVQTWGLDLHYNLKPNTRYKVVGMLRNTYGADLFMTFNYEKGHVYKTTELSWYSNSGAIGNPSNKDGATDIRVGSSHKNGCLLEVDLLVLGNDIIVSGRSTSFDGTNMYERLFSGATGFGNYSIISINGSTAYDDNSRLYLYEYTSE